MNQHNVHLLDLPNEIILLILKKLANIDVLYSFLGINNQRLDIIAQEEIFSNILNFVSISQSTEQICSISDSILERFCVSILPRIHHSVKSLSVETTSMECILNAGYYPNLSTLKLYNFNQTVVSRYFANDSHFQHIYTQQITDLILTINENNIEIKEEDYTNSVYRIIFGFFENLRHLTIVLPSDSNYPRLCLYKSPSSTCSSSALTKLCINVFTFLDVLLLLDGRLKQLTTFIVEVGYILDTISWRYKVNDLPTLKHFSLICYKETRGYDIFVLPLLRRMLNLEELTLYIHIIDGPKFITGTDLNNEILIHMPQLHTFTFYIDCETIINNSIIHVSIDDIQSTFKNIKNHQQIFCMVDYAADIHIICRIFSIPFKFYRLKDMTNNIPDIVFNSVTHLKLCDFDPFQHEFFVRLAGTFPFLKYLILWNTQSPFWKTYNFELVKEDCYSIIEYPHLISIDIRDAHTYYIEQFLNETKTHLPCLTQLKITYKDLEKVTDNFTRIQTQRNCAGVKQLIVEKPIVYSKDVYDYFPLLSAYFC